MQETHSVRWDLIPSRTLATEAIADATTAVARTASALRVPMTHVARDAEYLPVLAHRIASERRRMANRERELVALASDVSLLLAVQSVGSEL